jgi:hypothetical protein
MLGVGGLVVAATAGAAELRWLQTTLVLRAELGAEKVQARFPFIVLGEGSVKVTGVHASCDCTVAALEKSTWLPGERGEISVNFELGERVGRQEVGVFVMTDAAPDRPVELRLEVDIPPLLEATPRFLEWKLGVTPEERSVSVKIPARDKVKIRGVRADPARVLARLEPQGDEWRLVLRPVDASRPLDSVVHLDVAVAGHAPRAFAIQTCVR